MYSEMEKYSWETRRDAEILQEYVNLIDNPTRVREAQNYIEDNLESQLSALNLQVPGIPTRRRNKATIMKLDRRF